jgi:hypothetical protein
MDTQVSQARARTQALQIARRCVASGKSIADDGAPEHHRSLARIVMGELDVRCAAAVPTDSRDLVIRLPAAATLRGPPRLNVGI